MKSSKLTKHHVPPRRWQDKNTFVKMVSWKKHEAYHTLFGSPYSYEEARRILAKRWVEMLKCQLDKKRMRAFYILFKDANFTRAEKILKKDWWTRC